MKLLIWTENYQIGGCDRFLVDFVRGLNGGPVTVSLAGNPHPEFDRWLARRAPELAPRTVIPVANLVRTPLHQLDRLRPAESDLPGPSDPPDRLLIRAGVAGTRYSHSGLNFLRIRRLLELRRPDVLLINNGGYPGGESCRVAALAARRVGVGRVIHFVHNLAYPPAWPQAVEARFDRLIDKSTDTWVTAADRASDALSAERGIPRNRIVTVHYGIEPPPRPLRRDSHLRTALGFVDDRPAIACVANLEPRKGISVLLRALASLQRQGVATAAAIVGDGPVREDLEGEARALGLDGSVRFLGWREDVDAILEQADVLALPSLAHECLPYVILEAMAHGLPVVSTDVAGIPEMVLDGVTGRVVQPGDVDALAAALRSVVSHRARSAEMGERGRERLDAHFNRDAMVQAMSALLRLG